MSDVRVSLPDGVVVEGDCPEKVASTVRLLHGGMPGAATRPEKPDDVELYAVAIHDVASRNQGTAKRREVLARFRATTGDPAEKADARLSTLWQTRQGDVVTAACKLGWASCHSEQVGRETIYRLTK